MNTALNVHDMVALMHVAIGVQYHYMNHKTAIAYLDIVGGSLGPKEGKQRTFPVLDAPASICVSEPKGQVVAVAVQLQLKEKEICMTLAENREVKSEMVDHLTSICKKLKRLSKEFAVERNLNSNKEQ